jgi:hypothetical protein
VLVLHSSDFNLNQCQFCGGGRGQWKGWSSYCRGLISTVSLVTLARLVVRFRKDMLMSLHQNVGQIHNVNISNNFSEYVESPHIWEHY